MQARAWLRWHPAFKCSGRDAIDACVVAKEFIMSSEKQTLNFGVPWETSFGYVQAVKRDRWIYVSGQLSHDDSGRLVAPAPVDAAGHVTDFSNMEAQIRQAYANMAKVLAHFAARPSDIVEEVLYVLDVDAAFAVAGPVRKQFYGEALPAVACTMLGTTRLAFPAQLVEIKFVVRT